MIYQTDPEFPPDVYHFGCYMMSTLERLTTRFGMPFTHEWVLDIYYKATAANFIEAEDFVSSPQGLADIAVGPTRVVFLGKKTPAFVCEANHIEIQVWQTPGKDFVHFMAAQDGKIVYDPWSATGSATAKTGKCVGKRIFKIIA